MLIIANEELNATRSTVRQCERKTSTTGTAATSSLSFISSKTSGSSRLRRSHNATTVTTMLAQNGIRQPHEYSASSGREAIGMNTRLETTMPNMMPLIVNEVKNERRSPGACSSVSDDEPGDSPPADSPCSRRRSTRMTGAATPMVS